MNIYQEILKLQKENIAFVVVSVVDKEGHGPQIPGAKMIVANGSRFVGTIGGGAIEFLAEKKAMEMLDNNISSKIEKYILSTENQVVDAIQTGMVCGGSITLYFDRHDSRETICIFGAGHVGQALVYHLRKLNYRIIICDCRSEYDIEIDGADEVVIGDYKEILAGRRDINGWYFIIATHSHSHDYELLKRVCSEDWNPKYIGAIASKKKSAIFLENLSEELKEKKPDFSRLYCPVGLKIGGTTPDEIAISIAAEIQAVKYAKEGNLHCRLT